MMPDMMWPGGYWLFMLLWIANYSVAVLADIFQGRLFGLAQPADADPAGESGDAVHRRLYRLAGIEVGRHRWKWSGPR